MAQERHRTAQDEPSPSAAVIDALIQAAFLTMATLNRVAAEHDLSLTQLRVLAILEDRRVRMTDLADYLGLEKSTLSGLVARAEARGLLERGPSAGDRRVVEVGPTPAGRELAARGRAQVGRSLAPLTGRLSPAEQGRLQALLSRMLGSDPDRGQETLGSSVNETELMQ